MHTIIVMINEKDYSIQFISVQLNGQNYDYECYVIKKLKGKRMWSYVDETTIKLTNKKN